MSFNLFVLLASLAVAIVWLESTQTPQERADG